MLMSSRAKETILIVEDEVDIRELLCRTLDREGFRVLSAEDGEAGLELARTKRPDLLLLDLMLPGLGGLELARMLQRSDDTAQLPIVMLTAKSEETDVVLGLELGADDYITKPFSPREVIARVRAVLRRAEREQAEPSSPKRRIERDGLVVDADRFEVVVDGESIELTRSEFRLLWTLIKRPGRVFTRGELVDRITDGESIILERNVDVHVSAVRKKLGRPGEWLQTVRGVGYRLKD